MTKMKNKKTKKLRKVVLADDEYCHIRHKLSGKTDVVSGPARVTLGLGLLKEIVNNRKEKKIILDELTYAVINNPVDLSTKKPIIRHGETEIRVGPRIFPLYPGETAVKHNINIIERGHGLKIIAYRDFTDDNGIERKSGEIWNVLGPCQYIPNKFVRILYKIEELSLSEHSGVYVKNQQTGEIRLERGPQSFFLEPNEVLWKKDYTKSELDAIKFNLNFDRRRAYPLWVLENEVTKIMSEKEHGKIIFGPSVILLEPHQRPFVMSIAGGTPKNTKRISIWKIKLGPNFSTDIIEVRTRDNAVVSIKLRYQWKFIVDHDDPDKIYSTNDFVGLATEMMAGIIRDESANYDFEDLHSQASEIIKKAIFDRHDEGDYYQFPNGLRIFGIDIKEITPVDSEIAKKMNDAIKSNMQIYVDKMKQRAKIEIEKAQIDGEREIERAKIALLEIQNENRREMELIEVEIETEKIRKMAEAQANEIMIKKQAETEAEVDKISQINIALREGDGYIKLKQIEQLTSIKKVVVPSDGKYFLPDEILKD